jgi:hypothetical protein
MNLCALIDRHFAGELGQSDEARLRSHLPECAECRQRYRRHLLLERLDPRAAGPKARLARSLGLRRPRRPWGVWLGAPTLAAVAAMAMVVLAGRSGFVPRGGHGPAALEVYHASGKRVDGSIRVSEELAFAYRNPGKKSRLLVFGVDEHQHVFWYYPAWTKPAEDPVAVPIEGDAALHELREAIAQPLDGQRLRVIAWFLDEPLSVKRAEALRVEGKIPEGAIAVERELRVEQLVP